LDLQPRILRLRAPLALVGAALSAAASLGVPVRGAKPTPTVLRILRDNPGKRPFNKDEPKPPPLPPQIPNELTDEEARAEWQRTITPAITRGQITSADRAFAIAHCELWATWRSQLADAARHPHVVAVGDKNYPTPNPARGMANKTLMLLAKVDAELGLTPSSRTRVKTASGQAHATLEDFLREA
jgi:P27 family predicted phage terminase small subunit